MSKVMEERTSKFKVCVRRKCDLCGVESRTNNWDADRFDVKETELEVKVRQKAGVSYPEGGSGTLYDIDLCPECFVERLVPWLRSQGANIREEEWDW